MPAQMLDYTELDAQTRAFYQRALTHLQEGAIPFLIGGAYALAQYTGIIRYTKDLDVFVRERDFRRTLEALAGDGCRAEVIAPSWLGKSTCGEDYVDVIFASGNGLGRVDDHWFARAPSAHLLDFEVLLCPPEEMIWSKAFVMERERYDGADIAHLLRACADHMDWRHLLWRFGPYWRVLLSHLILFGFIYPTEREKIPAWVLRDLLARLETETQTPAGAAAASLESDPICQGSMLSVAQYMPDIFEWGYADARERTGGESVRAFQAAREAREARQH